MDESRELKELRFTARELRKESDLLQKQFAVACGALLKIRSGDGEMKPRSIAAAALRECDELKEKSGT